MDKEYDNTNRGALWPNDRMRSDKKDPEFTGSLNVDGVDYWVKGWKKKPDAKPGAPSLSIKVDRKDANKAPRPKDETQQTLEDFSDDIGF